MGAGGLETEPGSWRRGAGDDACLFVVVLLVFAFAGDVLLVAATREAPAIAEAMCRDPGGATRSATSPASRAETSSE